MRTLTPMAEKGAFVCQPVTSASERRVLREGFAGLFCEAASSAAGSAAETANGGLVLTDGVKRSVARFTEQLAFCHRITCKYPQIPSRLTIQLV